MTCDQCAGSGWLIVERNGYSAAERCPACRREVSPKNERSTPLTEQLCGECVRFLGKILPFTPGNAQGEELQVKFVISDLMSYVSTVEELQWLCREACIRFSKWPGLKDLRALFCLQFSPRDGRVVVSQTLGITVEQFERSMEASFAEREARETDAKLLAWKEEFKAIGAAPDVPMLPAGNPMPEAETEDRQATAQFTIPLAKDGEELPLRPMESPRKRPTREELRKAEQILAQRRERMSIDEQLRDMDRIASEPWYQEMSGKYRSTTL